MKWFNHFFILMFVCLFLFREAEKTLAQSYTEVKDDMFLFAKWNVPTTHEEIDAEEVWFWSEDDITALKIFLNSSKDKEELKRDVIELAGENIIEQGEQNYNGLWSFWTSTTSDTWPDYWLWCIGFFDDTIEPFVVIIYFKKNNDLATKIAGDIYTSFRKLE